MRKNYSYTKLAIMAVTALLLGLAMYHIAGANRGPWSQGAVAAPGIRTIVMGASKAEKKPASELSLTYPEAAVATSDGRIFIANTLGFTVEVVQGDAARTILSSRDNGTGRASIYNDLRLTEQNEIAILDAGAAEILFLDTDTYTPTRKLAAPASPPGSGVGDYYYMSSIDFKGQKTLVTATLSRPNGESQTVKVGRGGIFEWDGGKWITIIASEDATSDDRDEFRDAVYDRSGGVVAHIGHQFLRIKEGLVTHRIDLPGGHGGGAIQADDGGWLVGSATRLLRVAPDFSSFEEVPFAATIANVGHISRLPSGGISLTDTDRQTVYLQNPEGKITALGNAESSNKFVSLAVRDGRLLLLDNATPRVLEYDPASGAIHLIAGTGRQGYDGPKAADQFSFLMPNALSVSPEGDIFVTEANYRIARIRNAQVDIVGGDIHAGKPDEGASASVSLFGGLRGISHDDAGNLYLVDQGNHIVWMIDQDQIVRRVMGTGERTTWLEGEPAKTQPLNWPSGVLARRDGTVLIADSYNNTVAEIGTDGIVRCFAGGRKGTSYQGFGGYSGDGGDACSANLNTPRSMAEDAAGNVYIVDEFNNAIRKVTPEGTISTFAGGKFGFAPDGSHMNLPQSIAVLGDFLYVADTGNSIVWAFPLE